MFIGQQYVVVRKSSDLGILPSSHVVREGLIPSECECYGYLLQGACTVACVVICCLICCLFLGWLVGYWPLIAGCMYGCILMYLCMCVFFVLSLRVCSSLCLLVSFCNVLLAVLR